MKFFVVSLILLKTILAENHYHQSMISREDENFVHTVPLGSEATFNWRYK